VISKQCVLLGKVTQKCLSIILSPDLKILNTYSIINVFFLLNLVPCVEYRISNFCMEIAELSLDIFLTKLFKVYIFHHSYYYSITQIQAL